MPKPRRSRPKVNTKFSGETYFKNIQSKKPNSKKSTKKPSGRLRNLARLIVILLLVGLFYQFLDVRHVEVQVQDPQNLSKEDLTIDGGKSITQEISNEIRQILEQSWWKDNFVLINTGSISKQIEDNYANISQIDIGKVPLLSTLKVTIGIRQPRGVWENDGILYLIDQTGVTYSSSTSDQNIDSTIPRIRDTTEIKYSSGDEVISSRVLDYINRVDKEIIRLDVPITVEAFIISATPREINIKPKNLPYVIKLSTERSATDQIMALLEMLDYLKSQSIVPAEYIDLRVNDTGYYK